MTAHRCVLYQLFVRPPSADKKLVQVGKFRRHPEPAELLQLGSCQLRGTRDARWRTHPSISRSRSASAAIAWLGIIGPSDGTEAAVMVASPRFDALKFHFQCNAALRQAQRASPLHSQISRVAGSLCVRSHWLSSLSTAAPVPTNGGAVRRSQLMISLAFANGSFTCLICIWVSSRTVHAIGSGSRTLQRRQ